MSHVSDRGAEEGLPPGEELSKQIPAPEHIPAIEQICPLSHASKVIQVSLTGSVSEHEAQRQNPQKPENASSPADERPRRRTLRTYPIFDRDGKVARMIGVDGPVAWPEPGGRRCSGDAAVPVHDAPREAPVLFCGMIGASRQMRALFQLIRLVASSQTTILIYGESGTGKELVARAIHQCSARRPRAFVPVDCGALPETLLESELFGHVKGAFTGAIQHKKGLFEEAEGGTLFLDEIGDTSTAFQAKLLRALQEGEFRPVGGTRSVTVNVRVVAATNTRLKEAVAKKKFREDLYYRLAVMPVVIPPLRERPDDILPLADYFIREFARQNGKGEMRLSGDAADLLRRLPWRGNIRELENVIERAVLISSGSLIAAESLLIEEDAADPDRFRPTTDALPFDPHPVPLPVAIDKIRSQAEHERITDAIRQHHGNKSLAARFLGIARSSLYNKLKRHRTGGRSRLDPLA